MLAMESDNGVLRPLALQVGAGEGGGGGGGTDASRPPIPFAAARHTSVPYTREAIEEKVSGVVLVDLLVNEHGVVQEAKLRATLGHGLDPLALSAARRFRFYPVSQTACSPGRPRRAR